MKVVRQVMKTIGIVSSQGGLGKTTLAINLAAATVATGKRILVLSFRRDVGAFMGVKVPIWFPGSPVAPLETPMPGLHVLAAEVEAVPEWLAKPLEERGRDIRALVDGAGAYDFVVLDASPNPTVRESVAAVADRLVCLMSPTPHCRAATVHLVGQLRELRRETGGDGGSAINGVVTQVHTRDADAHRISVSTTNVPLRWAQQLIRYSAWYERAGEPHQDRAFIPALDCNRTSRPALDIHSLADELGLLH